MSIEEWLYRRCATPGRGWRWGLYLIIAALNNWWCYTSAFERWTVRVTAMLVAMLAGLALARIIEG